MTESIVQRDDFEYWLFEMDDEIISLISSLPGGLSEKMNFSLGSLVDFEKFILCKYPAIEEIRQKSELRNLSRYSRYVGEVVRKNAGGIWDICLDKPEDAYYRIPVLKGKKYGSFCPLVLVTSSVDRRVGDRLFKLASYYVESSRS